MREACLPRLLLGLILFLLTISPCYPADQYRSDPSICYGTTVIVHGYKRNAGNDLYAEAPWMISMAGAIADRLERGEVYLVENSSVVYDSLHSNPNGHRGGDGEDVIAFCWLRESDRAAAGYAEAAADALTATLLGGAIEGLWTLDQLHFIAHSRGAVVASETIQRLGLYQEEGAISREIFVDTCIHFTLLDPHPWDDDWADCIGDFLSADDNEVNNGIAEIADADGRGIVVWSNVGYADSYRQGKCSRLDLTLNGLPQHPGIAYILDLTAILKPNINFTYVPVTQTSHTAIRSWYYGTINLDCTRCKKESPSEYFCHDGGGTWYDPCSWYNVLGKNRNELGFNVGRNFSGSDTSAYSVVKSVALQPDESFDVHKIFNGDFSFNPRLPGYREEDPGWALQGGSGGCDIDGNRLKLRRRGSRACHNKLYIPITATHLSFFYEILNEDAIAPRDSLFVDVGEERSFALFLDHEWAEGKIDIPLSVDQRGTVTTISFEIGHRGVSGNVDSKVAIDDVHFIIDAVEHPEFEDR